MEIRAPFLTLTCLSSCLSRVPLQQAARIITHINPDIGVDLIVRTPAQVRERLAMQDAFMREILERGRIAYEANHA